MCVVQSTTVLVTIIYRVFLLVPPRKVLSMELVPFNRKNDQVHWSHPRPPDPDEYSNASIEGGPDVLYGVVRPVHNWKWPKNQTTTINGMEDHYLWFALTLLSAPILRSPLTSDVVESGVLPVKQLNSTQRRV